MFRRTWPKRWWPSGPEDALQLRADCDKLRKLAVPGAMMLALEAWAFEVSSLLAGLLRNLIALDAHIILLNVCGFVFLSFPFALGIAGSIRVGQLLGAGRAREAKRATKVLLAITTVGCSLLAGAFLAAQNVIGRAFTQDKEVVAAIALLVPMAAIFQVSDGVQSAVAGALRGMGRQKMVALLNFVGFWLIGTSIGAALTFSDAFGAAFGGGGGSGGDSGGEHDDDDDHDDSLGGSGKGAMGVAGLWWGLAIGISATSVVGVASLSQTNFQREAALARARVVVAKEDGNRSEVGMSVQL